MFDLEIDKQHLSGVRSSGVKITNRITGRPVGEVLYDQHPKGRLIRLFNKYTDSFESHAECEAFAKGVAAVLNHMCSYTPPDWVKTEDISTD